MKEIDKWDRIDRFSATLTPLYLLHIPLLGFHIQLSIFLIIIYTLYITPLWISTYEGTGIATAEALLRLLPHNGTYLYGITIENITSYICYHPVHK